MTAPLAAPADTAPTGAVYALGLKFLEMDREFERADEAARTAAHPRNSAKNAKLDKRCRRYDCARWEAFDGAMAMRACTAADALVQAVHAFDSLCTIQGLGGESREERQRLTKGALASLIAFLEPLAGLKADAFGWSDTAQERAAVLASLGRGARP